MSGRDRNTVGSNVMPCQPVEVVGVLLLEYDVTGATGMVRSGVPGVHERLREAASVFRAE
jgi:hypothetical protein